MSKVMYDEITLSLVAKVKGVIEESKKHVYSVSRVYSAYNSALGKRDTPQTCSSCLRNRVRELVKWMEGYEKYAAGKHKKTKTEVTKPEGAAPPQYDDPEAAGFVEPAPGVIRTPMAEGLPFDFTTSEESTSKGVVRMADGTAVKPGTYKTALGLDIAVQPGGRATIKEKAPEGGEPPKDDNVDLL